MADSDPKASTADDFAARVLTDIEVYRRRHRAELGLPGEVHDVHTTYAELAEFRCKHCRRWNRFESPLRAAPPRRVVLVQCIHCGDHIRVEFYTSP